MKIVDAVEGIYITCVCNIKKEVHTFNASEALKKNYPELDFLPSDYPRGIHEGSYDGTTETPFLVQVEKPNGINEWFVNKNHKNADSWKTRRIYKKLKKRK